MTAEGRLAGHAILWNLTTLADATTRLSDELKKRNPEIPWEQVRGFRNVAVHAYDRLHLQQVATVVEKELPRLRQVVEGELQSALKREAARKRQQGRELDR